MMPMQQRPLVVFSQLYIVWAGIRLEDCMVWQKMWIHQHVFPLRKKRGVGDAGALSTHEKRFASRTTHALGTR